MSQYIILKYTLLKWSELDLGSPISGSRRAPSLHVNCSRHVHRLVYIIQEWKATLISIFLKYTAIWCYSHCYNPILVCFRGIVTRVLPHIWTIMYLFRLRMHHSITRGRGGGVVWIGQIIYFTFYLQLLFFTLEQHFYFILCVEICICFHFLIYFSVYKFGSQTKPSLDLEANDPSKVRLHKCESHLLMPDKRGPNFFRTNKWCCSKAEIFFFF